MSGVGLISELADFIELLKSDEAVEARLENLRAAQEEIEAAIFRANEIADHTEARLDAAEKMEADLARREADLKEVRVIN